LSATAALSTDLKFYYSGPTGGSDDNRKFNTGGALSTPLHEITSGVNYNWFPDVSRVVITFVNDGLYWNQYACLLIKNTSTSFTMTAAVLSLAYNLIAPDNIVGIGISPKNAVPVSITNINTAPSGITFKEKVGSVLPTITLSDLKSGEFYAVWLRLRGLHGKPLFKFAHIRLRVDWTNVALPPPPPPPGTWVNFQDSTGPIQSPARILTLYPGGAWDTASGPSMSDINTKIKALCTGTYFSQLSQYRSIAKPDIDTSGDTFQDDNSDLHSTFTDSDMRTILNNWIDGNDIDSPSEDPEIIYCVFPDHNAHRNDGAMSGHSSYAHGGGNVHYAWSDTGDGIDPTMIRISKEIVNAISNPEPSGSTGTPAIEAKDGSHKSLADWCTGSGTSSGVKVNQYYSEANAACVVP
jgi:hypothetical protein